MRSNSGESEWVLKGLFVGLYERSLNTPAKKTGFANVFAASPPKKVGEFLYYLP
jgi:hypothetical protein